MTWFSTVMNSMKHLGRYEDNELVASGMSSAKMGFYYQDGENQLVDASSEVDPCEQKSEDGFLTEMEPGMFGKLPPGYKFQGFDPQHPTTAFEPFTKSVTKKIASGWGVSYEGLSNDRAGSSYSSARTGLMLERDVMRRFHGWWKYMFLRRLYAEWMNTALLSGELELGSRDASRYLSAKWIARGWEWIDPLNDIQAASLAVQNGLASRTQYAAERGLDVEEIFQELAEEQALAKEKGITLATSASLAASKPEAEESEPENEKKTAPRALVTAALNGNGHGGH